MCLNLTTLCEGLEVFIITAGRELLDVVGGVSKVGAVARADRATTRRFCKDRDPGSCGCVGRPDGKTALALRNM